MALPETRFQSTTKSYDGYKMFAAPKSENAAIVPTSDADPYVEKILQRHEKLKAEKQPWLNLYTKVGQLVMTRKQTFNSEVTDGQFLTGKVFESAPSLANQQMAASLIGALWSNSEKTFQISPPKHMKPSEITQEIKEWCERVTKTMARYIGKDKAGFLLALNEYMIDQGAFGISGIAVLENEDERDMHQVPVKFRAVDAKMICIDEGESGFVDTVYIENRYTVRQMYQMFGDACSNRVKQLYFQRDFDTKVVVLHAIEPRTEYEIGYGNQAMPIKSCYIEVETKHKLRETGYEEMPVFITRFWKASGEKYGRSPAMECMPDIIEANGLRQSAIVATEKNLSPPLLISDEVSGVVNTRAGGFTYRKTGGRLQSNGPAVEPLFTVGEMNTTFKRIAELREIIYQNFFIDRLLDLNNETRMTLGEAQIRNDLRGQSLGTIYSRQIAELFTPLIERVFNILLKKGLLGIPRGGWAEYEQLMQGIEPDYIPDAMVKYMLDGDEVYSLDFISPAARIMQNEELVGIMRLFDFVVNAAQLDPSVLDTIDMDATIRRVAELVGAPATAMRSPEEIQKIREQRAQMQAQLQQMEMQQLQADTMKSASQAAAFQAKARGAGVNAMAA